jgi:hypothetical protein
MYEGQLFNFKKKGEGKLIFNNGDVYEGFFKNDNFEGKGIFKKKSRSLVLKSFQNATEPESEDFISYEGEWKHGKRHGKGKMIYNSQ